MSPSPAHARPRPRRLFGRARSLITYNVEAARAEVLRARGRAPGTPRLQIFASFEAGGMGEHEHAYVYAAAALVDQFDRCLCAPEGSPGRIAVESAIARTAAQLGCVTCCPPSDGQVLVECRVFFAHRSV